MKRSFTVLERGTSKINKNPKPGIAPGTTEPNIQIYLSDYKRVSIWLFRDGETISWQFVEDNPAMRDEWTLKYKQENLTVPPPEPVKLDTDTSTSEDDNLPF